MGRAQVIVRSGARVVFLPDPSGGRWVLDDISAVDYASADGARLPLHAFDRHDETHYGIVVPDGAVRREGN
jgi:hypothetical protein